MNPRVELIALLMAVSFLTILVSIVAGKEARLRGPAFLAAWLLPGAGHAILGRWKKGLFFFLLLGSIYLLGLWIVGFRAISWDDNPFYYVGQWGSGATFLLARVMSVEKAYPRPGLPPSWFDPGLLYVCAVGLLNLVVMINVLEVKLPAAAAPDPAPAKPEEKPAEAPPAAPPAPGAAS